jgi:hypothetical protein
MTSSYPPPKFAQKVLSLLLSSEHKEIILGDFSEEHVRLQKTSSHSRANLWYWKEFLLTLPILISFKIRPSKLRRQYMKISPFIRPGWKSAFWSFLFLAPATFLVMPGLLQSITGSDKLFTFLRQSFTFGSFSFWSLLIHPAVIIVGIFAALLLTMFSILDISLKSEKETLVTILAVKKSVWNLIPLALAIFFALVISLYLIAENFGPFF